MKCEKPKTLILNLNLFQIVITHSEYADFPFENLGLRQRMRVKDFRLSESAAADEFLKSTEDDRASREEFSLGRPSLRKLSWSEQESFAGAWGNAPY